MEGNSMSKNAPVCYKFFLEKKHIKRDFRIASTVFISASEEVQKTALFAFSLGEFSENWDSLRAWIGKSKEEKHCYYGAMRNIVKRYATESPFAPLFWPFMYKDGWKEPDTLFPWKASRAFNVNGERMSQDGLLDLILSMPVQSDSLFSAYLAGSLSFMLLHQNRYDMFSSREDISTAKLTKFACMVGRVSCGRHFSEEMKVLEEIRKEHASNHTAFKPFDE